MECPACGSSVEKDDDFCKNCGLKLFETKENTDDESIYSKEKLSIDKDKIILLDLNYTLISNSRESFGPYPSRIYRQKYETELIELIKDNYVILITARPEKFSAESLDHIKDTTGFVPDESYWNFGLEPHELKEYWMKEEIFKKHGDNPNKYLAIESNPRTRRMYKKLKIEARPKQDFI